MNVDDYVFAHVTKDNKGQELTQKILTYIFRRAGTPNSNIPDIEENFSSGNFSGGEFDPQFLTSVEGKTVYLSGVSSLEGTHGILPEGIVARICFASQLAKDLGAKQVNAILPNHFFARSDAEPKDFNDQQKKTDTGRGAVAKFTAHLFQASGVDHIFTVQPHSDRLSTIYQKKYNYNALIGITPNPLIAHYLATESLLAKQDLLGERGENLVLIGPDKGASDDIKDVKGILAKIYGLDLVTNIYLKKIRKQPNNPNEVIIECNPEEPYCQNFQGLDGKQGVLLDDITDTFGTAKRATEKLRKRGVHINGEYQKPANMSGIFVHPVLGGKSWERSMATAGSMNLVDLCFLNTHPFFEDNLVRYLKKNTTFIRCASLIGEAIYQFETEHNVEKIYGNPMSGAKIEELFYLKRSSSHPIEKGEYSQ